MNTAVLCGRITKDPEIRYTNNQKAVCTFNLAIDDGYGDSKKTYFPTVIAWEAKAKYLERYAHKGDRVLVRARYTHRDWEDKNGNKIRSHEFVADELSIMNSRGEGGAQPDRGGQQNYQQSYNNNGGFVDYEDDVPF